MTDNEQGLPLDGDPLSSGDPQATTGGQDPDSPTHPIDLPLDPEAGSTLEADGDPAAADSDPTQAIQGVDEVYVILPDGADAAIPLVETQVVEELVTEEIGTPLAMSPTSEPPPAPAAESVPGDALLPTENLDAIASELDDEVLTYGGDDLPEGLAALPSIADDGGEPADEAADGEVARIPPRRGSRVGVLLAIAAVFVAAAGGIYFGLPFVTGERETPVAIAKSVPTPPVETPAQPAPGSDAQPPIETPPPVEPVPPSDPIEVARAAFQQSYLLSIQFGFVGEVGHE